MRSTPSLTVSEAAGYILMVSALSASLLITFLFLLPQFIDLYLRAGISVPWVAGVIVSHQGVALAWLAVLACLFALLSLTRLFRSGPHTVVMAALLVYATLLGAIALSLCVPLVSLVYRMI